MLKKQVMIMTSSVKNDCPRLNIYPGLSSNPRMANHDPWPGATNIRFVPRIPPNNNRMRSSSSLVLTKHSNKQIKLKQRLSGFFQAQLLNQRLKKMKKSAKKRSKITSKKSVHSQVCYLPEVIIAEIFKRLPVKYILRCMCVQKSWYNLVRSPMFISLQLNYQKSMTTAHNPHHPKYLFFRDLNDVKKLTVRLDDVQCQNYCNVEFLPVLPKEAWFAMSYGLICASTIPFNNGDHNRNIYLWNPLIQKYKTLPDSPLPSTRNWQAWEALAFGFVPEVDDYVVVHIVKPYLHPNPHSVIIGVYSLNTNSWKKFTQNNVFNSTIIMHHDGVVFVNAAAFWVGDTSDEHKILMSFDTKTNILSEISLPDWVADGPLVPIPIIHQFGQSIAYFVWENYVKHFDMWVLKVDPTNVFTWEKKMCVTSLSKYFLPHVLGVRNNGEPLLAKFYNLITYNLDNHEASDFVDSWRRWTQGYAPPYVISPFVESLVLLNID